jgi:holo-[acyl-carrier protein] synthase
MHQTGIDIIEIARVEKALARWGDSFLKRIYTKAELNLYHHKLASLAVRLAGKEATVKALGITRGVNWKEIEILSHPNGKPLVRLSGRTQNQARKLGLSNFAISLSHCREYAIALVTAETRP